MNKPFEPGHCVRCAGMSNNSHSNNGNDERAAKSLGQLPGQKNPRPNTPHSDTDKSELDMAIVNFVYSGLSLEQMNNLPKCLIKNMDKNKPNLIAIIEQQCNQAEARGYINGGMLELGNFISDSMYTGRKTVDVQKLLKAYDELSDTQAKETETE